MGKLGQASQKVACNCNGTKGYGSYKVEGRFLELTSELGTFRAQVGLMDHHWLATKLLKNVCARAAEKAAQLAANQFAPAVSEPSVLGVAAVPAASP